MEGAIDIIQNPEQKKWDDLLKRPAVNAQDLKRLVRDVFDEVAKRGDDAVREYTLKFDQVSLEDLKVSETEFQKAVAATPDELKQAIKLASENIGRFHASQQVEPKKVLTSPGVQCWQEKRPIERVGLYIPGGTAPLFSTVLMLSIPARIAGCQEIILCTPPDKQGKIEPAILYAAQLCGVSQVLKVGGIQAIAALSLGTETIRRVYKIFGPGNQYVTAAKQEAQQRGIAIDLPAGPSELMVVADSQANPAFVAADLLSQAEHGSDSQVVLVSDSLELLEKVREEVGEQLKTLPRREVATAALEYARFILLEQPQQMLNLVNQYAPEHLIINTKDTDFYSLGVINAGSVFIGQFAPESAGDYASGTNHTLPTGGYAKQYSGVNLDSFQKAITFQEITKEGLQTIGPAIESMARAEGLIAHQRAVSIRINSNNTTDENI